LFGIGSGNGSFGFRFFCLQLEQLPTPPLLVLPVNNCSITRLFGAGQKIQLFFLPVTEQLFDPVLLDLL
jgi:hypothetical protein